MGGSYANTSESSVHLEATLETHTAVGRFCGFSTSAWLAYRVVDVFPLEKSGGFVAEILQLKSLASWRASVHLSGIDVPEFKEGETLPF